MSKGHENIYGLHTVRHALQQNPDKILSVWIQESKKSGREMEELVQLASKHGIHIEYLEQSTLDRHTENANHQGVVCSIRKATAYNEEMLEELLESGSKSAFLFLVLDGVQDPHNLGACIRTANAAGVDAVIIPRDRSAQVNATVNKVASGAVENTPVISVTNLARTISRLQEAGLWIVGTNGGAENSLYDLDLTIPIAIVLGSEGKGLRRNTQKHCDYLARLPMHGIVESLNVSVATGVCLYEAIRQRMASK